MARIDTIINESLDKILIKEYQDNDYIDLANKFIQDYREYVGDKYFIKKCIDYINFEGNIEEFALFIKKRP